MVAAVWVRNQLSLSEARTEVCKRRSSAPPAMTSLRMKNKTAGKRSSHQLHAALLRLLSSCPSQTLNRKVPTGGACPPSQSADRWNSLKHVTSSSEQFSSNLCSTADALCCTSCVATSPSPSRPEPVYSSLILSPHRQPHLTMQQYVSETMMENVLSERLSHPSPPSPPITTDRL